MPDDLVAKLRAAIEAKAAKARAATEGPWWTPPAGDIAEWAVYGVVSADHREGWTVANAVQYPHEMLQNDATKLRPPATAIEHANANAEHIADNDPQDILRRCAADRKIVDEHRIIDGRCHVCTALVDDMHPGGRAASGRGTRFRAPCPTLRALAEYYRLTTEATQ